VPFLVGYTPALDLLFTAVRAYAISIAIHG